VWIPLLAIKINAYFSSVYHMLGYTTLAHHVYTSEPHVRKAPWIFVMA